MAEHDVTLRISSPQGDRREMRLIADAILQLLNDAPLADHHVNFRLAVADVHCENNGPCHAVIRCRAVTEPA